MCDHANVVCESELLYRMSVLLLDLNSIEMVGDENAYREFAHKSTGQQNRFTDQPKMHSGCGFGRNRVRF